MPAGIYRNLTMASIVSLKRCSSYRREEVYAAVKDCVDLLGGMEVFIKPGESVLIKPNLLSARPPEECITTHPEVLRAVIKLVKKAGGAPMVGDSHGGSHHRMEHVYDRTGIGRVCSEEDTKCLIFEKFRMINGVPVALPALESDKLISVPKFKTHSLTVITAGVKNIFGVVPGLYKTRCHMEHPNPSAFSKLLVDIYGSVRPDLTILDGIGAMEGEGPGSAGTPRNMDLIAVSEDAVSVDALLCAIIGINPYAAPTVREAAMRGLGEGDLKNIKILGDGYESFRKEDFKLPKVTFLHRTPNVFLKTLTRLFKMVPDVMAEKCGGCGVCVKNCPAGACHLEKGRIIFERSRCILCLCCLEFCPNGAVYIRKNMFSRLLRR